MENYAKLLFATNELPKEVEQTHGYFRRWLIVPFDETIPESEQDKETELQTGENDAHAIDRLCRFNLFKS